MTQEAHPIGPSAEKYGGLIRIGGALGIAACFIGFAIFLAVCAGLNAAMVLSVLPMAFSVVGLVLVVIGGVMDHHLGVEDTPVVAAVFTCVTGIIGSLLLIAIWMEWPLFGRPAAM